MFEFEVRCKATGARVGDSIFACNVSHAYHILYHFEGCLAPIFYLVPIG